MAHTVVKDGTVYEIVGGKALHNGAIRPVEIGAAMAGGSVYDISFSSLPPVGTTLNDMSWADIRAISDAGLASNYFAVGDRKAVVLSGTVGRLSLSGTYFCYIIGIDHNVGVEGANRIHFQFGYTALSGGVHFAFVDDYYSKTSGSECFHMNKTNVSTGGWEGSYMRDVVCPAFKEAMPSELRAVLKAVTKYSNNTGGSSNTASYVTATSDEVFLLAEWEVFGKNTYANSAEKNYQKQYSWYSAGNSKVKYKHDNTGTAAIWFLRSVRSGLTSCFCAVTASGDTSNDSAAYKSFGFAPAFCV